MLLTGARRGEVAGLAPTELDLDQAVWTLPADRAKNDQEHAIDLSAPAIRELRALDLSGHYVFGRRAPASGWSQAKRRLDQLMAELANDADMEPPAPWRIHDLRRTAASGMAGLGFQPIVVEKVLNHQSGAAGGLVAVYQRYNHRDERRQALAAWGRHLAALTSKS
jgi:integrase